MTLLETFRFQDKFNSKDEIELKVSLRILKKSPPGSFYQKG